LLTGRTSLDVGGRNVVEEARNMEIRRLQTAGDAEICARMMSGSEPYLTLRRDYDACLKVVSDPLKESYVVRLNGGIVGILVIVMNGALTGYIQSICIAPEFRGRGIGSQLMAFAERRVFREAPNVFLMVSSFNHGAQRLYRRLGYEVIGELKDFIVSGHSEILLRKTTGTVSDFKRSCLSM